MYCCFHVMYVKCALGSQVIKRDFYQINGTSSWGCCITPTQTKHLFLARFSTTILDVRWFLLGNPLWNLFLSDWVIQLQWPHCHPAGLQESLCLFHAHLMGELPDHCNCESPDWNSYKETKETHGESYEGSIEDRSDMFWRWFWLESGHVWRLGFWKGIANTI